jgi:hypothetical protein
MMLNSAERNYYVIRQELLVIIRMQKHFHKYLYGRSCPLFGKTPELGPGLNGRIFPELVGALGFDFH